MSPPLSWRPRRPGTAAGRIANTVAGRIANTAAGASMASIATAATSFIIGPLLGVKGGRRL